ncbi:MAG: hypothetical protein SCARUB_05035 [Candidatus Scalindua rubra]|uniref:Uncharacterized protein n=1 Tax=Candidatus Scalindua rubra TaxID=1872076 RepID=A0A1E3X4G6_9BACT|nr:MAG: hypothetical protein SCARUB_05035 [Candidatus Scalindua rubra]
MEKSIPLFHKKIIKKEIFMCRAEEGKTEEKHQGRTQKKNS